MNPFAWLAARKRLAAVLLILLAFVGGVTWSNLKIWPYGIFSEAYQGWKMLRATNFLRRFDWALSNIHKGQGVTLHERGRAFDGLTMMSGIFEEGVRLRLVNMEGRILRDWPVEFEKIWPNPAHIYPAEHVPDFRFGFQTFGFEAAPDGSVVTVVENLGLVKLDRCGKVMWTLDKRVHHNITHLGDGTYWVGAHRDSREVDLALDWPGRDPWTRKAPEFDASYEDLLLHVSGEGKVLREISVLKALLKGVPWHLLHAVAAEFEPPSDPTHLNDVEIVTPALAARVPGANAGDLLVSIRNLNMLAIISLETGDLVWYQVGPWVRQHDPDIEADGRISVFDNHDHMGWDYNKEFGGSQVMLLDPKTGASEITWPKSDAVFFYTRFMGAHEAQPNGNMLITESAYGRVLEMAPDGALVWQYVQPIDPTHAALIPLARRFAPDYFEVTDWSCPSAAAG
jgi:hypothetical protein